MYPKDFVPKSWISPVSLMKEVLFIFEHVNVIA